MKKKNIYFSGRAKSARSLLVSPSFVSTARYTSSLYPYEQTPFVYSTIPRRSRSRMIPGKRTAIAVSALSGSAAAAMTVFSAYVAYKAVRPSRKTTDAPLDGYLLPPEKIIFKTSDNLNLSGYFYPHSKAREAIVICHGFHGSSADLHAPAITLQNLGYNVLTFDFRSCGNSEGRTTSCGFWEVLDVLGAINYVKSRPEVDPGSIGLYGFSMGGATAIMTAALSTDVKVVIADSAFAALEDVLDASIKHFFRLPSFPFATTAVWFSEKFAKAVLKEVKPFEALAQIKQSNRKLPIFLIHGEADLAVPVSQAHKLFDAASEPKELWTVPDCPHIVAHHYDSEEYVQRIGDFFYRYLKSPSFIYSTIGTQSN